MPSRRRSIDVDVVVSGGTGSATIPVNGEVQDTAIDAPSQTADYDVEVFDEDNIGVFGRSNLTGDRVIKWTYIVEEGNTLVIDDADEDGTYKVRLRGAFD